jgi:hypothetical protein
MQNPSSKPTPRRGKVNDPAAEIDSNSYSAFVVELKRRSARRVTAPAWLLITN